MIFKEEWFIEATMELINFPKPELHLFICINERSKDSLTPSCCPRIMPEEVTEFKRWLAEKGWASKVYCTKAKCLGFCNLESSVAVIYPEGKFLKYNSIEELKEVVIRRIDLSDAN